MIRTVAFLVLAPLLLAGFIGCSDDIAGTADARYPHGDGGADAAGVADAGEGDAGGSDAGPGGDGVADAGLPDAAAPDAGEADGDLEDAASDDAGETDAGQTEDTGGTGDDAGAGVDGGDDISAVGCEGSDSVITGTTYAPNGVDPIPYVVVYMTPDTTTFPAKPATVTCDACAKPKDPVAVAISGPDGKFALYGWTLNLGGSFTFVMDTGSFRHVVRHVAVGVCMPLSLPAAQTRFSGTSTGEDVAPHIVVASDPSGKADVNDKLVRVLDAIGVKYDTVLPDRTGGAVSGDLLELLASPAKLAGYDIVAVPCGVLGNFTVGSKLTAVSASNVLAWLKAGGRLYASDLAYEVVAQTATSGFTWAPGPSPNAGADHGDSGVGLDALTPPVTSIDATVVDADLLAWLQAIKVVLPPATTIPVVELRDPWGALDAVTTQVDARGKPLGVSFVTGTVSWYTGPTIGAGAVHPLTAQVDVVNDNGRRCGRVAFTSYHMQSTGSGGTLSPQEHVLEYLLFQLSRCVTVD